MGNKVGVTSMVRLENTQNGHSKFYEMDIQESRHNRYDYFVNVAYGRINISSKRTRYTFPGKLEAEQFIITKTNEKLRKGYIIAPNKPPVISKSLANNIDNRSASAFTTGLIDRIIKEGFNTSGLEVIVTFITNGEVIQQTRKL
jgi:predicted DNA-binding WGR domain protein